MDNTKETSEQELKALLDEGKITHEEYQQLLEAMQKQKRYPDENSSRILWPCKWGEYKSKSQLFGLPLVHIVYGPALDPATGKFRVAKGIIAIGGIAVGVVAVGGASLGLFALGGLALGILSAMGGVAIGTGISMGGLAVGFVGFGGMAVGYYAIGGGAFGVHAFSGNTPVEQLPEWLQNFKR